MTDNIQRNVKLKHWDAVCCEMRSTPVEQKLNLSPQWFESPWTTTSNDLKFPDQFQHSTQQQKKKTKVLISAMHRKSICREVVLSSMFQRSDFSMQDDCVTWPCLWHHQPPWDNPSCIALDEFGIMQRCAVLPSSVWSWIRLFTQIRSFRPKVIFWVWVVLADGLWLILDLSMISH